MGPFNPRTRSVRNPFSWRMRLWGVVKLWQFKADHPRTYRGLFVRASPWGACIVPLKGTDETEAALVRDERGTDA